MMIDRKEMLSKVMRMGVSRKKLINNMYAVLKEINGKAPALDDEVLHPYHINIGKLKSCYILPYIDAVYLEWEEELFRNYFHENIDRYLNLEDTIKDIPDKIIFMSILYGFDDFKEYRKEIAKTLKAYIRKLK